MPPPSSSDDTGSSDSDPLFGVVTGIYLALLAAPLAVFAAVRAGVSGSGVLYGVVIGTLTVVTGLGWLATARVEGVDVRLGGSRLRWLPALAPAVYVVAGFASIAATGVAGFLAFFFGLFAVLFGFVLGVMARTRHTIALTAGVEPDCEFTAGWPKRARRRVHLVAGVLLAVTAAGFIAGIATNRIWLQTASQILFPLGLVFASSGERRTYLVSAVGIEQRMPVARRLFRWDDFGGYTRTADAIILHRPRRVDFRFALADLDDSDAIERAIERYLSPS